MALALSEEGLLHSHVIDDTACRLSLTAKCMESLERACVCRLMRRVLVDGDAAEDKSGWSRFKVLRFLHTDGWVCAEAPPTFEAAPRSSNWRPGSQSLVCDQSISARWDNHAELYSLSGLPSGVAAA